MFIYMAIKLKVLVRGCYIPFYREQSLCWFGKSEAPVFKAATIKEMPAPFISETVWAVSKPQFYWLDFHQNKGSDQDICPFLKLFCEEIAHSWIVAQNTWENYFIFSDTPHPLCHALCSNTKTKHLSLFEAASAYRHFIKGHPETKGSHCHDSQIGTDWPYYPHCGKTWLEKMNCSVHFKGFFIFNMFDSTFRNAVRWVSS